MRSDYPRMRGIAFVDICGTLVDLHTLTEFVRFVHETTATSQFKRIRFALALTRNRFGLLNGRMLRATAVKSLTGIHRNVITSAANEFFDRLCRPRLNNELIAHLECLKDHGYKVVLVSATLDVIAETIMRKLNFHGSLATLLEFRGHSVTGAVVGEYCEKGEKVRRIKAEFGEVELEGIRIAAYGNTLDDLYMLEWSSFPHVIWGSRELRMIGIERGWQLGVHPFVDNYDINTLRSEW